MINFERNRGSLRLKSKGINWFNLHFARISKIIRVLCSLIIYHFETTDESAGYLLKTSIDVNERNRVGDEKMIIYSNYVNIYICS